MVSGDGKQPGGICSGSLILDTLLGGSLPPEKECSDANKTYVYAGVQAGSGLLDAGYEEMGILSRHAVEVAALPPLHKDPFDRMLLAQANVEGCLLLTADQQLLAYRGPVTAV